MGDTVGRARPLLLLGALVAAGCAAESPVFSGRPGTRAVIANVSFMQVTLGVRPYDPFAPFAAVLDDCVYLGRRLDPCTLLRLPPLGLEHPEPSVDDVMGRVLVSHEWMGIRLREVLESFPPDLLLLFRPITSVVVSGDVRPSFYWAYTGAIYLDASSLWLSDEERRSVTQRPDFRTNFDAELSFSVPRRYIAGGRAPAYRSRPRPGTLRSFAEVRLAMARLLYHELAHANDYLSPRRLSALSPYQYVASSIEPEVQRELAALRPLRSAAMFGLAAVAFTGRAASPEQKALSPEFVAAEFGADRSNDFYAYSSQAEDVAMLFDELMTLVRFGVDKDVAVTRRPSVASPTAADYIVLWGQRNRVGDPEVRERARLVARRILPELPVDAWIDALPAPRQLVAGRSLLDNTALSASGRLEPLAPAERRAAEGEGLELVLDCATALLNERPRPQP